MPEEAVTFHNEQGATTSAAAEVVRYSTASRITSATMYIGGGLLGAAACIIVPVAHLFTTWGLPLLGIIMGVRALRRHTVIFQPSGPCPSCGEHVQLPGGSIDDPDWQECPNCRAKLSVRVRQTEMAT